MPLDQIVVVLHRPRDVRNIGAVVRAMKNMGFARLRLVAPAPYEPADLLGIAHRSEDVVAAIERYDDLPAALADARYVVGTSERAHPGRPMRADLRPLAAELLARAAAGPVAVLFGPEDNGLDSAALDRCHAVLSLPADPAYPSLNLAQAALLVLYELRAAAIGPPPPARPAAPATAAEHERFAEVLAAAMDAVGFVKSGDGAAAAALRRLRAMVARAEPDSAELALLTALMREVVKRQGRERV
ncbi:MAG: RNA methyltransferase [Chloroflexales bacterium]|nr:RNA methyltransferase [Chloroflexales bacterium]